MINLSLLNDKIQRGKAIVDIYKLKKLLDINNMLTKSLQLDEILKNVISSASELIEVSDVLLIYLYDDTRNKLYLAEGQGIYKQALEKIAFSPGESIAGKVYAEKQSKLFSSEEEIDFYMENMTQENYAFYSAGVHQRKIKSAFCVPIITKEKCYGVVVVDNFNQDGVFTKEDMEVIERIAKQSAIAIDNAKAYQEVKEKKDMLEKSISIHNQFYQFIIDGRGMNHVIQLLEKIISSTVTFHSYFDATDDCAFPIVRGDDILGCLKLDEPVDELLYMDQLALEQASLAIALQLIKNNALFEKEIHFHEAVFNQIISRVSERDLQHAISYVKWQKDWNVQCMILEGKQIPLWDTEQIIDKERFIQSIENIVKSKRMTPLIFTRALQLIVIIPTFRKTTLQELIEEITIKWGNKNIYFGIGRATSIADLQVSFEEAIRSINYAKQYDVNQVEYSMLGIERLLYEVNDDTLTLFMEDKLQTLLNMDQHYMTTLQMFISTNKNHKQTAQQLHIHPNTLYHRLRKIEKTLKLDLNDNKSWIDLVIALKIYVARNKNS